MSGAPSGGVGLTTTVVDSSPSPPGAEPLRIDRVRITHPDALLLIEEVQGEYVARYGGVDETPLEPEMFDPPAGAFFVGYLAGRPVVMGGWRFRQDVAAFGRSRAAEVKRMYVVASGRRTGLARRILATLEADALAAGADVMVLETGTGQPEAIALYLSAGYAPVEGFGYYKSSPMSRYFGKPL